MITAELSLPRLRYVDVELERRFSRLAYARATRFFDDVLREARGVPGVSAVGAINALPLMGEVWGKRMHPLRPPAAGRRSAELPDIQYRVVAGDYFRALGIPILAGRAFTEADTEPAAKVAIVNRSHGPAALAGPGPDRQADLGQPSAPPALPRQRAARLRADAATRSSASPTTSATAR